MNFILGLVQGISRCSDFSRLIVIVFQEGECRQGKTRKWIFFLCKNNCSSLRKEKGLNPGVAIHSKGYGFRGLRDGSVGYSACCGCLRTHVWIPRTRIRSALWLRVGAILALGGKNMRILEALCSSSLAGSMSSRLSKSLSQKIKCIWEELVEGRALAEYTVWKNF